MLPVGLLYQLTSYLLDGKVPKDKLGFFIGGIVVVFLLVAVTTYFQYNATFFSTYVESGVRRRALAEKLRRLPLSFFGKKDLSDLTNTIMSDCALLETGSSHWIPELIGSMISTTIIVIGLLFFNWKMALAAVWVMPIAFIIVLTSRKGLKSVQKKTMTYKLSCLDGIQEGLETIRDLRSNNMTETYMEGLNKKIKAVEKNAIVLEFKNAAYVCSAQMILKLGIGTVALVGSILLVNGKINVLTLFVFLLVVTRMYEPLQIALQNLSALISLEPSCERMDEILSHEEQTGAETLTNKGYDIVFDHVAFAYDSGEQVLSDVSFTAKQGQVTALIGPSGGGKTTVSRLAAYPEGYCHGRRHGCIEDRAGEIAFPVFHRVPGCNTLQQHGYGEHPDRSQGCNGRGSYGSSQACKLYGLYREITGQMEHHDRGKWFRIIRW